MLIWTSEKPDVVSKFHHRLFHPEIVWDLWYCILKLGKVVRSFNFEPLLLLSDPTAH